MNALLYIEQVVAHVTSEKERAKKEKKLTHMKKQRVVVLIK